jgi:hypothetical protein
LRNRIDSGSCGVVVDRHRDNRIARCYSCSRRVNMVGGPTLGPNATAKILTRLAVGNFGTGPVDASQTGSC